MAKAQITEFKIVTPDIAIISKVRKAIRNQMWGGNFFYKIEKLQNTLAQFLYEKFLSSSTYFSLTGGTLRAEFGLDDYEVSTIPDILIDLIKVGVDENFTNNKIKININFIGEDIDLRETGAYTYKNKKGETYRVTWLMWLLTAGENDVVLDYSMKLVPGKGRSEMAIMIKPKAGGSYSVDPEYSGTAQDNWITRTIRNNIEEIREIIKRILSDAT